MKVKKAIDKLPFQSLKNKAREMVPADYCLNSDFAKDRREGIEEGFKLAINFIEERKLEGVGFQQLLHELKIISEA